MNTYFASHIIDYAVSSSSNASNYDQNIVYSTRTFQDGVSFSKDDSEELFIPITILANNSSLEAIVKYLKEVSNLKFSEIAKFLNRDQRTVWVTYSNSKKKNVSLNLKKVSYNSSVFSTMSSILVPVNIFVSRDLSILESIVFYLHTNQSLSFNDISKLLAKNYRTIWTVYNRALKKLTHEN